MNVWKKIVYTLLYMLPVTVEAKSSFIVGGWLPYWKTDDAISSVKNHVSYFNELSPFSYEINKRGELTDPFAKKEQWAEFFAFCHQKKLKVVPSLFWTDTEAMHTILSNKKSRDSHIQAILDKITALPFAGVNINYERVSSADRDGYLNFLIELSKKLRARKLELHCTIEGRTSDTTFHLVKDGTDAGASSGGSTNPARELPNSRYKKILAQYCDRIIVMAYDEWGQTYLYNQANLKNKYYLSHTSKQWLEQIIRYMRSFIPAHKLVLGIPTYGLEFTVTHTSDGLSFKKAGNPTYIRAQATAKIHHIKPKRTAGGELAFTFPYEGQERYMCYIDSTCIKERLIMAKKYGLKGVYLFKIDGAEDKAMWPYLKAALKF